MDSSIFLGGSVVAAVVAGSIALFAPCCISVMLPAYFASAFQNRRLLVAMTFLFAAGIATIVLPIAMGAAALRQLFTEEHTALYLVMGALMLVLGAYTLLGGKMKLPMPGRRASGNAGPLGVYSLGVFSGVASSCCAPVLAGVVALSGLASSFGLAVGLGAAYVFGMVAPLFVMSLFWERVDWRSTRLFRQRSVSWRIGPVRRTVTGTAIASGVLLVLMGAGTVVVGLTTDGMPASTGWQADVSLWLQGVGREVNEALGWLPGWAAVLLLLVVVALLARRALRQVAPSAASEVSWPEERIDDDDEPSEGATVPAAQLAASAASGHPSRAPGHDYA